MDNKAGLTIAMMMMMMMMMMRKRRILVTRVLHFFSPNIYIFDPTSASTQGISLGKQWCQNVDQPSSSSQQRFHIIIISRYLNKKIRTNWLEWQLEAYWQYSLGTSEKEKGKCKQLIVCETICDTKSLDTKKYVEKYFEKYSR